jgi:esterase/lipase
MHGFTGNPWEVEPLANALKESGYQVLTPLLPGHHILKKRMGKATAEEWIQAVEEIVKNAFKENKEIHLIGFSMGALIAALIASRYKISTLVLLSPAVYMVTPKVLVKRIRNFYQLAKENRKLLSDTILNNLSSIYSTPFYNILQFQKSVRQAKKIFPYIHIPICIIHGQKDEIVDPRSSEWVYRVVPSKEKELHYLCNSKHLICQGCEADTVNQTVIAFLEKHHLTGSSTATMLKPDDNTALAGD